VGCATDFGRDSVGVQFESVNNARAEEPTDKERGMTKTSYSIAAALLMSLLLGACQTTNPYTGQQQTSNTTKGVGIGAAAGAVIGALAGGSRKSAMIGAGIGAIAGGGVGAYMDNQEKRLREQLQGTGVSVTRSGDNLILNMPGNITFATNQSDVKAEFYPVLNSVALVLKEYNKTMIDVVGFTDSTGALQYNMQLSQARAVSVASYLQSQGVQPVRIATQGMGPQNPIASNDTPEGRAQNRRVELILRPLTA
jgi:outer membrane protein OmpA-like peptidoglycan-associated protein